MISRILLAFTLFLSATQSRALAEIVEVRISGTVLSNFVSGAPLDADAARVMEVLCAELPPAQAARIGARLLKVDRSLLYAMALERQP